MKKGNTSEMKTGTLLRKWSAALIAVVLMISLFAMPAFAHEGHEHGTTGGEQSTETTTETTTESSTGSTSDKKDDGKLGVGGIIGICIAGAIVVVAVIFGVKYRANIAKYLRVLKSESKKIVWFPWDQTKKNTFVVLIVLIACAAAICLLDFALNKGFLAFIGLF
jgi:preprotein translocase SecE subunit